MTVSLNSVNLVGRTGQDPDIRYFESGKVKATFSLAVDRGRKDDQPDWFNVECWGKTAEVVAQYVRKGKLLSIQGSLKIESWVDKKTGATRSKPIIACDRLQMLGSKRDEEGGQKVVEQDYNSLPVTHDADYDPDEDCPM